MSDTLRQLFEEHVRLCQPAEVWFIHNNECRSPEEWLKSLDASILDAPITEMGGSVVDGSDYYTTEKKGFLKKGEKFSFNRRWNSERHGWSVENFAKVVHYFVPEHWLIGSEPAECPPLISLCKGMKHVYSYNPFNPGDGDIPRCKKCSKLYENWSPPTQQDDAQDHQLIEQHYHIAQNGQHIGRFTFPQIQELMASGQLTDQDYYYSASANNWLGILSISAEPLAKLDGPRYQIAQGGQNLGEFTLFEIQQMVAVGQLTEQDAYYSPSTETWLNIVSINEEACS